MSDDTLECPCCGDVGARGIVNDGDALLCGCPGQVSLDAETEPYINSGEDECVPCRLRARVAELEAIVRYALPLIETHAENLYGCPVNHGDDPDGCTCDLEAQALAMLERARATLAPDDGRE